MYFGHSRFFVLPALILILAGCSTRPTYYIQLQLPGENVACQGVEIEFLSYDYPLVLDSLRKINNPGPRPDSTELMALLNIYQEILERSARMADSCDLLREDLEKLDNKSIQYRKKYPVYQRLEKQVKSMLDERHAIHQNYLQLKSSYDLKVQDWSRSAYKGFSDFKSEIPPERQTKIETTDQDCMVKKLVLPFGMWWLHAEARKPGTTNEKLIWNMQLPTDADSVMIILDESSAQNVRELL
jgi:hypothetical protein